jgi:hypothetical protein
VATKQAYMAQILLDDFFLDLEKCSQIDPTHFLRARFTHGEEIMPFTDLLKIPVLCHKQTPANETYTYENNGWRGELVCPMSANIQWDLYRHYNYSKTRSFHYQHIPIRMLLMNILFHSKITVNHIIQ